MDDVARPGHGPEQPPVPPEDMRAGDADREQVLERLRAAHAEGRLDLDEFEERVTAAVAARTYGELGALTVDLPGDQPEPRPIGVPAPRTPARPQAGHPRTNRSDLRGAVAGWVGVSVTTILIWAVVGIATGVVGYPWWIWVAGPWGVILLLSWWDARSTGR